MFQWKRENLEGYPRVFARFMSKNFPGDALIEYRIQDLPEERFENAVKFLANDHYLREEPLSKAFEIKDDVDSVTEFENFYRILFREKTSLVCFKENSDEIIALNAMSVVDTKVQGFDFPINSQRLQRMVAVTDFIKRESAHFEPRNIDFVLAGKGLCVDRNYRRRGIATKMLEARVPFMKHLDLTTTITLFTAKGSQISAKKAGYDEYYEVTYDDLMSRGFILQNVTEHSIKTLGYEINKLSC